MPWCATVTIDNKQPAIVMHDTPFSALMDKVRDALLKQSDWSFTPISSIKIDVQYYPYEEEQ